MQTGPDEMAAQEAAEAEPSVPATNQDAIRVITEWAAQSSEYDDAFWRDLELEIQANRLTLGSVP